MEDIRPDPTNSPDAEESGIELDGEIVPSGEVTARPAGLTTNEHELPTQEISRETIRRAMDRLKPRNIGERAAREGRQVGSAARNLVARNAHLGRIARVIDIQRSRPKKDKPDKTP